jgi:hypothetical protein
MRTFCTDAFATVLPVLVHGDLPGTSSLDNTLAIALMLIG